LFGRIFNHGVLTLLSLVFTVILLMAAAYTYIEVQLPDVETLKDVHLQVPLRIYTSDGKLIGEFGTKRRMPIPLDQVPPQMIQAVLATEDNRFYHHPGVDLVGLGRALKAVVHSGRKVQGASTITMQVARNFFLSRKKTVWRKFNEILLALKIERDFSKDKILELYLNKIYFGHHAYGVEAAAHVYYGKSLKELTLAQMAMLAGLPQAPSANNPISNPKAALERRNHVLERMLEVGYIDQATYEQGIRAPLTESYHDQSVEVHAPHVAEMVRELLVGRYGEDETYNGGFVVRTTLEARLQEVAYTALQQGLDAYNQRHGIRPPNSVEGAIVVLNPDDGAIKALSGGYSFKNSHFNRATQAERQPGSNFKPFLYSAALEKGNTLATVINDAPIVMEDSGENELWRPQNDNLKFNGPTRLREGLTHSRNLVSIRLLQSIGVPYTLDYVARFGFDPNKLPTSLSLALGSGTVTPLQIARGFAVFANGGYLVQPYFIESITQIDKKIFEARPEVVPDAPMDPSLAENSEKDFPAAPRVITLQNAYLMTQALRDVVQSGTATSAKVLGRDDIAGKTGTTNEQVDAWFSGFNSRLVATVWVGFDEQRKSLHEYGARAALPIWINFMRQALSGTPEATMPQPADIVTVRIDPATGLLAAPGQSNAIFESFTKDTAPTDVASPQNSSSSNNNRTSGHTNGSDPLF